MKNKNRYLLFGNNYGTLKYCSKHKKYYFNNLLELLDFVVESSSVINGVHAVSLNDLSIRRYCYDCEMETYIYLICTDRFFDENYIEMCGHPVAYKYFVDLNKQLDSVCFDDCKRVYVKDASDLLFLDFFKSVSYESVGGLFLLTTDSEVNNDD